MNLTWIAGLMIFVLLEKTLPWPALVSRLAGIAAIVAGLGLIST
jgi:predicted metal-binding membrane protein